jgi:cytochrome c peroxidase
MNAIVDPHARFEVAFDCGDELFEVRFNALDGVGARVGDGQRFTRVPRADKKRDGEWARHVPQRATGPNAEACNTCHNDPIDDGSGPAAANVIRDPEHSGRVDRFVNRNTPHVFGIGALQRLAEEMTEALQAKKEEGRGKACDSRRTETVNLTAKDVSFGSLRVRCDGEVDARRLVGVDSDLIVRPLQWKGVEPTVRSFNRGASHHELGMQPVEITGDDVDGDGDGVVNELGVGDMSALAIYLAAQPRPVSKVELADFGLMELSTEDRESILRGEALFTSVGCADCHRPSLVIDVPIFSEPSQVPTHRDSVFPAGQDPLAVGVDPTRPIAFDLTHDQPDNVIDVGGVEVRLGAFEANAAAGAIVRLYGDLKRHDMGRGLAENIDEAGTGSSMWMTQELWGVGSTGPYLHDGRATTITEAIVEHGGEAEASRNAPAALSTAEQRDLLAFLENLILFKLEEE